MQGFKTLFDIFRGALLPNNRKWEYAQFKEGEYWKKAKPYYMPWIYRLNRFGYSFMSFEQYVNCIPLSNIIERFPFIRLSAKPTIIDMGCGPSGIGFSLINSGRTYCIDPLLDKYELLHGYKENVFEKLGDKKILICSSGEDAVIPEKADLLFCINVLDHSKDPSRLIKTIYSNLTNDGYLFLMVNGYSNKKPLTIDPLHPHKFTEADLRLLMDKNGFNMSY